MMTDLLPSVGNQSEQVFNKLSVYIKTVRTATCPHLLPLAIIIIIINTL